MFGYLYSYPPHSDTLKVLYTVSYDGESVVIIALEVYLLQINPSFYYGFSHTDAYNEKGIFHRIF